MPKAKKSKKQLDAEIAHALKAKGSRRDVEGVVEDALFDFWAAIAKAYPTAKTGDLSPMASIQLKRAATSAVEEWIENNVL